MRLELYTLQRLALAAEKASTPEAEVTPGGLARAMIIEGLERREQAAVKAEAKGKRS